MARLIDADKLYKVLAKPSDLPGDTIDVLAVRLAILTAPEVEAIPKEWIKEHIAELRAEVERKIEEENYTDYDLCSDAYGMERLLEDWEKENDISKTK